MTTRSVMISMAARTNLHRYGKTHQPRGLRIRVKPTTIVTEWRQMNLIISNSCMETSHSSSLIPEGNVRTTRNLYHASLIPLVFLIDTGRLLVLTPLTVIAARFLAISRWQTSENGLARYVYCKFPVSRALGYASTFLVIGQFNRSFQVRYFFRAPHGHVGRP